MMSKSWLERAFFQGKELTNKTAWKPISLAPLDGTFILATDGYRFEVSNYPESPLIGRWAKKANGDWIGKQIEDFFPIAWMETPQVSAASILAEIFACDSNPTLMNVPILEFWLMDEGDDTEYFPPEQFSLALDELSKRRAERPNDKIDLVATISTNSKTNVSCR